MRGKLGIGLAATIALVGAMRLGPERSVLSAGPLSTPHAGRRCEDCHTPFRSFADDAKCLRCHAGLQPAPVTSFSKQRCVVCHGEHRGGAPAALDRTLQVCESCHEPAIATMGVSALPTARLRSEVEKFHRDHGPATRPTAPAAARQPSGDTPCLGCHPMDAAEHVRKAGGSPNAGCSQCHPSPHATRQKH